MHHSQHGTSLGKAVATSPSTTHVSVSVVSCTGLGPSTTVSALVVSVIGVVPMMVALHESLSMAVTLLVVAAAAHYEGAELV